MKYANLLVSGLLLAAGLYLILCDVFRVPSLQASRVATKLSEGHKVSWHRAAIMHLTEGLAKHIRISQIRHDDLASTLQYAGINQTPEAYIANIIIRAAFRLVWIIPSAFIIPILIPIIVVLTINKVAENLKAAEKIVWQKRQRIDRELPRFVSTLVQELRASPDVLTILEKYQSSAGPVFQNELQITIAGMKSGNQEQALLRLSARVGSTMLSEVVRSLINVLHGDNGVYFFTLLDHDYKRQEYQMLESEALKRPVKMKKYSYGLVAFILATYIFVTYKQLFSVVSTLFH